MPKNKRISVNTVEKPHKTSGTTNSNNNQLNKPQTGLG